MYTNEGVIMQPLTRNDADQRDDPATKYKMKKQYDNTYHLKKNLDLFQGPRSQNRNLKEQFHSV